MQKFVNLVDLVDLVDLVKSFPKRKKPKAGYGQNEPKAAASKRCRKDSSGDKGTTCKKVKPL